MAKKAKKAVPGHLIDQVKLVMYENKCSYAKAAAKVMKENPEPADDED